MKVGILLFNVNLCTPSIKRGSGPQTRDTKYQPMLAIVMDYSIMQDLLDLSQIKEIMQKDS